MAQAQALRKVGTIGMAFLGIGPCLSHADVVTDWNVAALNATAVPPNSILQSRVLAIVHGAIYDAVRAVDGKGAAYAVDLEAPRGTSVDAAVAAAAHGTLVRLAPAQRPAMDAALGASLSRIADGKAKSDGIELGERIAERSVALRSADQSDARVVFTPKAGAGLYQVTLPHSMAAILPQWGSDTPFVVRGRSGRGS